MEQDTVKVVKRHHWDGVDFGGGNGHRRYSAGNFRQSMGRVRGAEGCPGICRTNLPRSQEFQVDKAAYSLSVHGYEARVEHAQKEDVFFTVTVKDGQIVSDSYQADVREKGNTVRRLEGDYAQMVQQRLEEADLSVSVRLPFTWSGRVWNRCSWEWHFLWKILCNTA